MHIVWEFPPLFTALKTLMKAYKHKTRTLTYAPCKQPVCTTPVIDAIYVEGSHNIIILTLFTCM